MIKPDNTNSCEVRGFALFLMEVLQLNLLEQKIKILNILKLEILRNK